jgi:hypothetical protein
VAQQCPIDCPEEGEHAYSCRRFRLTAAMQAIGVEEDSDLYHWIMTLYNSVGLQVILMPEKRWPTRVHEIPARWRLPQVDPSFTNYVVHVPIAAKPVSAWRDLICAELSGGPSPHAT